MLLNDINDFSKLCLLCYANIIFYPTNLFLMLFRMHCIWNHIFLLFYSIVTYYFSYKDNDNISLDHLYDSRFILFCLFRMKISIRDKGKVHLSSLYYRKRFSKTNATIATFQVNQLVFSHLSVAIRAFPIATYCHLLPHSGEKRGILSEKAEEYLLFSTKNNKKVEKKTCGFEHFLYFCNQQEKFLPIPPRS